MQKLVLSIIIFLLPLLIFAQNNEADQILGEWLNEEKDEKIEIYKTGNSYFGKVTWAANLLEADGQTSKKDGKNPDEKHKGRNLIDATILNNFAFTNGLWDRGTLYDSKSGKTYSCIIKMKNKKLEIRSYVGVSLFGKSTYWERLE
ncbi:DUF2147 domain-containing protein [Dyadobacter sp. CY312]|uniref:DUF2147 domain-containing protein n=1 Tax=Dyadobacter sp. CY312 TaxID=2907303 RepID=UPI001F3C8045|nr:DUF2147 domain-containing protein [Dyadobacter sp. CY312]MCE7039348.1 DUF2147 domain-containing protein [Dyadobacter sp. CY312]